ncbi:hypothetical protein ACYF6T_28695 [Streptomyces sp. 7R007]
MHLGSRDPVDHGAEGVGDVDVPVRGDGGVVDEGLLPRVGDGVGGDQLAGVGVDEEASGEGAGDQQAVAVDLYSGGLGAAVLAAWQEGFERLRSDASAVDGAVVDAAGVDGATVGRDALWEGIAAVDGDRVGAVFGPVGVVAAVAGSVRAARAAEAAVRVSSLRRRAACAVVPVDMRRDFPVDS